MILTSRQKEIVLAISNGTIRSHMTGLLLHLPEPIMAEVYGDATLGVAYLDLTILQKQREVAYFQNPSNVDIVSIAVELYAVSRHLYQNNLIAITTHPQKVLKTAAVWREQDPNLEARLEFEKVIALHAGKSDVLPDGAIVEERFIPLPERQCPIVS